MLWKFYNGSSFWAKSGTGRTLPEITLVTWARGLQVNLPKFQGKKPKATTFKEPPKTNGLQCNDLGNIRIATNHIYRPQRKSGAKVIFSEARVSHSVHGRVHGGGCAWQGACVAGGMCGACMVGVCMAGGMPDRGGCIQERRPLKRAVRILLECILMLLYCRQESLTVSNTIRELP